MALSVINGQSALAESSTCNPMAAQLLAGNWVRRNGKNSGKDVDHMNISGIRLPAAEATGRFAGQLRADIVHCRTSQIIRNVGSNSNVRL